MTKVTKYTWNEFEQDVRKMSMFMVGQKFDVIFAVVKGGLPLGVKLANMYNLPLRIIQVNKSQGHIEVVSPPEGLTPTMKVLIVDDISDSGKTLRDVLGHFHGGNVRTLTIHYKSGSITKPDFFVRKATNWVQYPWE